MKLDEQAITGVLRRMARDPVLFVSSVFGATPTDQQVQVLRALGEGKRKIAVSSGHGIGKSTTLAWVILWFLAFRERARVPCTAPSASQLKQVLWSEIRYWVSQAVQEFAELYDVKSEEVHVNGAPDRFAVARTSRPEKPEALQGFHSPNLLFVIDEASGVCHQVFESARGALSTRNSFVLMASNPTQTSGFFYDAFHKNAAKWTLFTFSSTDSPLVDEEFWKDVAEEYGEDSDFYRVRVLGKFPRASISQLIPTDLAEEAMERSLARADYVWAPKILGLDVAWEGDDRTSLFLRQGLASREIRTWPQIDHMALADIAVQTYNEEQARAIMVDQAWGAGVISRMKQLGVSQVLPVAFGGSPIDDRFQDKRTEMWVNMRDWLREGGALPKSQELLVDLTAPCYGFTTKGRIVLESKKLIKARGLKSPDMGDALALTFAVPIVSPERGRFSVKRSSKRDYDVLSLDERRRRF